MIDLDLPANIGLSLVEVLTLVGLSIGVAFFFAAIIGVTRFLTRDSKSEYSASWLMQQALYGGIPFGIVGMASGYLTASSRVGAMSALVPAGLTLVGGVAVYLLGKGGKEAIFAAFAVIDFSVMMVLGAEIGMRERLQSDQALSSLQIQQDQIKQIFVLKQTCDSLKLDSSICPPKPLLLPSSSGE
jgi:hypothetical protein